VFQTFRNAWKIPELKNRLLFTLAILVVYRLGCAIPVPFVSGSALTQMFSNGNMLTYLDMMSGGALSRCTLFALGVTPYINASIIVQLLTVAIPSLEIRGGELMACATVSKRRPGFLSNWITPVSSREVFTRA